MNHSNLKKDTKYAVYEPFVVAAIIKHEKSNYSYGNSRIYKPVWHPIELQKCDIINSFSGLSCHLRNGDKFTIAMEPKEFAPFEKKFHWGDNCTCSGVFPLEYLIEIR